MDALAAAECAYKNGYDKGFEDGRSQAIKEGNWVQVPCYIGQDIWKVYQRCDNRIFVYKGKISMLQQKADGSWKFRVSSNGSVYDCTVEDIGRQVFFTEASAIEKKETLQQNIIS